MNNEIYGISCEVALMNFYNIKIPDSYKNRYSEEIVSKINKLIKKKVSKHLTRLEIQLKDFTGENQAVHDFVTINNNSVSVKSNKYDLGKVCPQTIGQTTTKKLIEYFNLEHYENYNDRVTELQKLVFNNLPVLLKEYLSNLMSSDYLLYFYNVDTDNPDYLLITKESLNNIDFSNAYLSKNTLEDWISSNTVKINDSTIGEFQIHVNRDSFKFRFNFKNLIKLISYKDEDVELYNSDCLDFLSTIESNSIDLVLIDPPYFISRDTGFSDGEEKGTNVDRFRISYNFGDWDKKEKKRLLIRTIEECYRVLKKSGTIICFYDLWKIESLSEYLEKTNFKMLRFGEWIKTNPVPINSKATYLSNSREVFISAVKGGKPSFNSEYDNATYYYPIYQDGSRFHPTQKSLPLFEEIIKKHSNENEVVLDCFSGSGTTMIAAKNTNRKFVGCELSANYFLQSIERIKRLK